LTDIWDQPSFVVKTKNMGTDTILGPYINILGCMTPEITSGLLKSQIISGGFSRRCFFVNALTRGKGVARPVFTPEQQAAFAECKRHAEKLLQVSGPFRWTAEAEQWFDAWYEEKEAAMSKQTETAVKHYYSSKDGLLLKVAMLVALSETDELLLTVPCLTAALAMIDTAEIHLVKVFEGTGRNELITATSLIADFIRNSSEPVVEKQLRNAFWSQVNTEEFNKILLHLQDAGKIVRFTWNGGMPYVATPEIADSVARQASRVETRHVNVSEATMPGDTVAAASEHPAPAPESP
jgi:hypothetical protein